MIFVTDHEGHAKVGFEINGEPGHFRLRGMDGIMFPPNSEVDLDPLRLQQALEQLLTPTQTAVPVSTKE